MEAIVKRLVDDVKDDLVFPKVALKAMKMIDDESTTAYDLADIIAYDPYLASSLLRIANSPFYGFSRKVENLYEAISLLGFEEVRKNIVTFTMKSMFRKADAYDRYIWEHSLGVAVSAPMFKDCVVCDLPLSTLYLMGLLHDMGKIVLKKLDYNGYMQILRKCYADNVWCAELEKETFGFTHADVGGALLEFWGLPREIVDVVVFHHGGSENEAVKLVRCCDALVNALGIGRPSPLGDVEGVVEMWDCKKISEKSSVEEKIKERVRAIEGAL